jgi:hypothetical protein
MAVTPLTGKTHPRYLRLLANGHNLSGDMRSVGSFGTEFAQADATGWSDGVMQYLAGRGSVMLDGFTAIFNNTPTATGPTAAGSHDVMATGGSYYVSLFIGVRAAPAIGDPCFASVFEQGGYTVTGGGDEAVMLAANFGGSAVLPTTADVWGVTLAAGTELTGSTNGGSVNNGASSSDGYIAFLHVPQTTGAQASNDWAFVIEDSADDSSFSTLATFTADGSAITAERLEGTGTVEQYVRLVSTRTAGTARPWVTFIRL